jgi:hypothetical protein
MQWKLANPLEDVEDIVEMALEYLEVEGSATTISVPIFRKCVTMAATLQLFDKGKEFLAVCRDGEKLVGYCWFDRGGYTTYSADEISNAKFHHVSLNLSVRQRVKLINEMLDQHILWASNWRIPVICSTSIRGDHEGFMRIHRKRGFETRGSYAWIRTEDAIRKMNVQSNGA